MKKIINFFTKFFKNNKPVPSNITFTINGYLITYIGKGKNIMANVQLNWQANAAAEAVTDYAVYKNGAEIGRTGGALTFVDPSVPPGVYQYEIAAVGGWGPGPKSDPASTPQPTTKPTGLVIVVKLS